MESVMIKREIKEFKLDYGDATELSAVLPTSVYSVLERHGLTAERGVARFHTVIHLDSIDPSRTYALRLYRLSDGARVRVNGKDAELTVGEVTVVDISGLVLTGDNLVEILFGEESDMSVGIWDRAELLSFSGAIIGRLSVSESHTDGAVEVNIRTELIGRSESMRAVATLVSPAGQVYYSGVTRGRGKITVKDPLLWWPRGLGVQSLYRLTVNLYGESEIEDTAELRIGLSSITTAKSADGRTLEVSGVEFLPMGAVYSPRRELSVEDERRRTEWMVSSAQRAGFNTLIIPSDAPHPSEYFYELCDVYGIVVIHELSGLDGSVRRLLADRGHHASFGPVDIIGEGERLDELAESLREILPSLDFSHYEEREGYISFATVATEATLSSLIPKEEYNLFSPAMDSALGTHAIDMLTEISRVCLCPKNPSEFVYLSGVLCKKTLGREMIRKRLARGSEGRAVYDRIGSSSGAVSRSAIDSSDRWKAQQYAARSFFTPTLVYAEADGATVGFSVSNERRLAFVGEVEYRILDNKNNLVFKGCEQVAVTEMSARKVFTKDFAEYISGHEREYYLEYLLREGSSVIYRDTLLFVRDKEFSFTEPSIRFEVAGSDRRFSITLAAEAFAKDVEIEFSLDGVILTDNYIDLSSPAPVKISVNTLSPLVTAEELSSSVKVRSMYDVG